MGTGWFAAIAISILGPTPHAASLPQSGERAKLLERVQSVARPGIPGPVVVFGERAFSVIEGAVGDGQHASAIAAGMLGSGRVVAFGHNGYMSAATAKIGETELLARNLAAWTAKSKAKGLKAGAHGGAFKELFTHLGYEVVELPRGPRPGGADKLALIGCAPLSLGEEECEWLGAFVASGGGLFCGDTPWGWQQLNPGKELAAQPGQQLLARAGLVYASGYLEATGGEDRFAVRESDELLNASRALDALLAFDAGKRGLEAERARVAGATLQSALRWLPEGDFELRKRLTELVRERSAALVPSESSPIRREAVLQRALVQVQHALLARTAPNKLGPHPCGADFPGAAEAPGQVHSLELDTSIPQWRSTGAYAAPGARIEISLPSDAIARGLLVQIGAHTDELWHLDEWKRHPQITTRAKLEQRTTLVTSPFGGLIYLDVPHGFHLARLRLQIRGAVAAPRFVLGETSLEEWRTTQRSRPAPWADLESRKLALCVPSSVVRALDDPQALMEFWDRALDAMADLAGRSRERERPERIVCDRQISAGYMHSGYPIMTHLDVAPLAVDLARLERGEDIWGFVHELGHNHQRPEWTFDGTGEVTCNVLGMYVIEKVCKLPPGKRGHDSVDNPPSVAAYRERGAKFDEWKSDPFLALAMYVELRDALGWTPFEKTFAEYRTLSEFERPRNDDEKRDQWLVRLSRNAERNLGPFFESWGVPTSEKARASIANLPAFAGR